MNYQDFTLLAFLSSNSCNGMLFHSATKNGQLKVIIFKLETYILADSFLENCRLFKDIVTLELADPCLKTCRNFNQFENLSGNWKITTSCNPGQFAASPLQGWS
jgi:hypothetical protein